MDLSMYYKYYLCFSVFAVFNRMSFSQTDSSDIYNYSFSQLSKIKITSVSKMPQHISEVPSTVFVVTATEIKEKGYFTLDEVLSDLPGFQSRNILGINSYVFQRGIPSQNNLILLLIDGIQVNELNSGGFYGGGQYNLSDVERVEVVYGPASVTYGTNAVSGVINIISKKATDRQLEINSLFGSFNTVNTDIGYCYSNKKKSLGIKVSGMYKQSDKADLKGPAGDNNWTYLMDNFENDYAVDLKIHAGNFVLGTDFLQKQASTATSMKSTGTIYRDYGTSWNIRFINNYIKYNTNASRKMTFSSTLYNRNATVLGNTVYYVVDTAQIGYYRPNNLTGFENILSYNANHAFSITGGLLLEYEQLSKKYSSSYSSSPDEKPPVPSKPAMERNYLASIYIEPRYKLFKSLYLSAGIRLDQSSIYNQVITPRAGISYNYRNHILRFSYAEAFRAPKPWDYTDGLGNSSLLPEKMKSLEASMELSIINNLKVDMVVYKNSLKNAITKQTLNTDYRWINEGEVNTDGLEVYIRYFSQKLKSSLSYTFNKSYNANGELIPEISKHSGNASLTWLCGNYLSLNLRAQYFGKRENPKVIVSTNKYYVDPYVILNGTSSLIKYKGFTMQLIIKNILNTKYYHTSNREPDRYRQPQRTIMLSVGYSLKN